MEEKLKILYETASKHYDLGSYDDFKLKMAAPEKQKAFYDVASKKFDLGSYEDFSAKISQKKNPAGSVSSASSSPQKSAPVVGPSVKVIGGGENPVLEANWDTGQVKEYKPTGQEISKSPYKLTVTDKTSDSNVTTGHQNTPEENEQMSQAARERIKAMEPRLALNEVRVSRKGDYESDAVERMERGLTDMEKLSLNRRTPIERLLFNTDVTSKEYKAQSLALSNDQENLSKGLDGIDEEIRETLGDSAFEQYEQDIADYELLYKDYELAKKNNQSFSQEKADNLNNLKQSIEKFQNHPLVAERNGMIKAMNKNLSRFKQMQEGDEYKGVREMIETRKAIAEQVDGQDSFSDASGVIINSLAKMVSGAGRLVKSTVQSFDEDANTPISDFLIDIQDDADLLFPSPSKYTRPLRTSTAKWNGYEVDFSKDKIQAIRKDGKVVDVELTPEQEAEVKNLGRSDQWNLAGAPYQVAQVVTDMAVMLAGAGKITKGLTEMGVAKEVAAKSGVMLSIAGQTSNKLYEQGLKVFDGDKQKASQYAVLGGLSIGAVGTLFGLETRLLNGTKGFIGSTAKTNIPAAVGQMTLKQKAATGALAMLRQGVGEGLEESVLENAALAINQSLLGGTPEIPDANEMISNGVMGFAVGSLFGAGTIGQEINDVQKSSLLAASKDPVTFEQNLRKAIERGDIDGDEEFISRQVSRATRIGAEVEKLGPDIKEEKLLDAIELIDKRLLAEQRLDEVKGNEELEARYQAELDVINKGLSGNFKKPEPEVQEQISENAKEEEDVETPKPTTKTTTSDPVQQVPEVAEPTANTEESSSFPKTEEAASTISKEGEASTALTHKVHVGNAELFNDTDKVDDDGYVYFKSEEDAVKFTEEVQKQTGDFLNVEKNEKAQEGATSPPTEPLASTQPATPPGGVKKRVLTERAYEGTVREEVKTFLEEKGLTRNVVPQAERSAAATELIGNVGEDMALEAVKSGDIRGAMAASTIAQLIKATDNQMAEATDPAEIEALAKKQADLIELMGNEAFFGGEYNAQLAYEYENSDIGYNLEVVKKRYEKEHGPVPAELEAKWEERNKQLLELEAKIAEAEKKAEALSGESAVASIKESLKNEAKIPGKKIREASKELAKKIRKGKIMRPDVFSAASPASLVWDGALEIVATTIEAGGAIAQAVSDGLAHIKASDWYNSLKDREKKAAESAYLGHMDKYQETVGKPKIPVSQIRELVASGTDTIEGLVEALMPLYPEATEREVRDAITGYGKVLNMSQDEVSQKLRKAKRAGRIISALEDVSEKKRPLRSGLQRDKLDAKERAMQKELREAMKGLPMDEETAANEQRTALDAKKARLRNRIEDLETEIKNKKRTARSQKTVKPDEEVAALEAERDRVKAEWDKIFNDEAAIEAKRLDAAKARTAKSIEMLEKKLREGDFTKKKNRPVIEDTELTRLKAEKLRLQEEYDKEFYKQKLKGRTMAQKAIDGVWQAWGLTRVLMATGEFSFIGIQGLTNTIAHPLHAVKAFKNAMRFLVSDKKTNEWLRDIKSQDFYPDLKNSKLALTEVHAEIKAREELFMSQWSNLIWDSIGFPSIVFGKETWDKWRALNPLAALERAAVGYLDTLRVLRFLDGREKLMSEGKTFQSHPQDFKDVADAINTLTGRASLGPAQQFAPTLAKLFFSPRNWASQIKTATPYAFIYFGRLTPTARKMALADFGKAVGFTTTMVMMAAAALNNDDDDETGVEFDPRSSDFGKIKLGDIRIDPWGGRIQQVILSAKLIMDILHDIDPGLSEGGVKKADGKIYPLGVKFKTPTKADAATQMAINKLAPSASILYSFMSKEENKEGEWVDKYGNPYSITEDLKESLFPIYWKTLHDLHKDGTTPMDGVLTFLSFFGIGVNQYEAKKK